MRSVHDLIVIFLIAFLLDVLFGDPHSRFHPVALFGSYARRVETVVRKLCGNGRLAGICAWCLTVIPVTALAWTVTAWCGIAAAGAFLYISIALRSLLDHSAAIRVPLRSGDLEEGRHALSMIVSRKTEDLPESEIVRGGIESLGENLIDAVASACFWCAAGYGIGGVPGAAAGAVFLRALNTLDACWGYRNDRYLRFGWFAARFDDAAHWIPARLTAVAIALASGHPARVLRCAWRHRNDHPSPNSCWGMAAFAGALGIRLGGPTEYPDGPESYPYWGDGRAELDSSDLLAAERLALRSALIFVILIWSVGIWL